MPFTQHQTSSENTTIDTPGLSLEGDLGEKRSSQHVICHTLYLSAHGDLLGLSLKLSSCLHYRNKFANGILFSTVQQNKKGCLVQVGL